MASKARKLILGFLCLLLFLVPSSSLLDKLVQGQEVKNEESLVSAQGKFKLGFFNFTSNHYYLGIWYINAPNLPVWVANRDTPIFHNSGSLTIDDNGNLKISYNSSFSIELYSGQEGSNNTSAVLLDNGNFVLRELSPEGVVKRELWQSFDHPTDTLLPGMKLGVDHKTRQTWSLRSWRTGLIPDVGSFTFGLDPNQTDKLIILFRGELYWTSGS
ncbi:G-type lectin S-receptor-like serine/threonine-protein kinase CES101, partial [Fagus crenata]